MGKDRRAELAAKVGLKKAQAAGIGGAAKAAGDVGSAYFDMEARKEVARQEVHKAAVQQNQGILHELDRPFLDYNAQVGTKSKPATLGVQLSILSAYMLGVMGEKLINDSIDMKADAKPGQFTQHALLIRAPLTAVSGGTKLTTDQVNAVVNKAANVGFIGGSEEERANLTMLVAGLSGLGLQQLMNALGYKP